MQTAHGRTERRQDWILQLSGLGWFLDRLLCQGCWCYCYYSCCCCCCRYRCWRTETKRTLTAKQHFSLPSTTKYLRQANTLYSKPLPSRFPGLYSARWTKENSTKCFLGIQLCGYCPARKASRSWRAERASTRRVADLPAGSQTFRFRPISSAPMTHILALVKFAKFIWELENKEYSYWAARVSKGRQGVRGKKKKSWTTFAFIPSGLADVLGKHHAKRFSTG